MNGAVLLVPLYAFMVSTVKPPTFSSITFFWNTSLIPRRIQWTQVVLETLLYQGVWKSGRKSSLTLYFSLKYCQLHPPGRFSLFLMHLHYPLSNRPSSRHVLSGSFRKLNHLLLLPGHKSPFLCCHIHGLVTVPNNISQHVKISHYKLEEVFRVPGIWNF